MTTRDDQEGVETRGFGNPPLDIWKIPEDMVIDDGQADAMIHFLQSRAAERIMLATEKLHEARKAYQRAEQFLTAEQQAVSAFLATGGAYGGISMHEILKRHFPERIQAITEEEAVDREML